MYLRFILIFFTVSLFTVSAYAADNDAQYVDQTPYLLDMSTISPDNGKALLAHPDVYVGDRRGSMLEIKTGKAMANKLQAQGVVLHPSSDWSRAPKHIKADNFTSYDDLLLELATLAAQYPELATPEEIGNSIQGRKLAGLRIEGTGTPARGRVEFRLLGCHHGDEFMSAEIPRMFARYLLTNYGSEDRVTHLMDNASIFIVPMVNPDGHESNTRENARGVDINRNYSFHWKGWTGGGGSPLSEPEPLAVAVDHFAHAYAVSFSFHTYGDIVNYVWNYTSLASPDEAIIDDLSVLYASFNDYQVINGFDWYQTTGDTDDFSYGTTGDFDWTIEMADDNIEHVFSLNYDSIFAVFTRFIDEGFHLHVTDADTGDPLRALVRIQSENGSSPFSWIGYTSDSDGSYHRLLDSGNVTLEVWAPGYDPKSETLTFSDTALSEGIEHSISLDKVTENPGRNAAWQITEVQSDDNNPDFPGDVLGPADGRSYALGHKGIIMLQMPHTCRTGAGPDLLVTADASETYTASLSVSSDIFGTLRDAGQVGGPVTYINLPVGIEEFSVVHLKDDGDANHRTREGFMLDSVVCLHGTETPVDGDIDEDTDTDPEIDTEAVVDGDADIIETVDEDNADPDTVEIDGDEDPRSEISEDDDELESSENDTISEEIETDGPDPVPEVKGSGCAAGTGLEALLMLAFLALARKKQRR